MKKLKRILEDIIGAVIISIAVVIGSCYLIAPVLIIIYLITKL